jgi:SAM-dependent methyltransferase
VPDRERLISVLLDVVETMAGTAPTVVDLACGPGSITCRLFDRLPRARSIAVDVDPVVLTIAAATFADDDRVQVVRADLRDPGWRDALPESPVDAILTATALHWLPEDGVRRLYRDLAGLVPRGGVVAHSEQMPLTDLPRLGPALAEIERQRRAGAMSAGPVGTPGGNRHPASRRFSSRWPSGAQCSRPPIRPRSSRRRRTGTSQRCATQALRKPASSGGQAPPQSSPQSDSSSFLRPARRHTLGVWGRGLRRLRSRSCSRPDR